MGFGCLFSRAQLLLTIVIDRSRGYSTRSVLRGVQPACIYLCRTEAHGGTHQL